jgi:hypothetical protein
MADLPEVVLAKALLTLTSIVRTHPDLSAVQQMDLGFTHGTLIKLRREQAPEPTAEGDL